MAQPTTNANARPIRAFGIATLAAIALFLIAPMRGAEADAPSYKDASYDIAGHIVTLAGGVSEVPAAPGSASKVITQYFGNDAAGDLNGDGVPDVAFLLTQSTGGSGTFYYIVAALKTATGYAGTNGVLLGDRIAPQTTEVRADGTLIVNYAERKAGEPMTTRPSLGVSKYLRVTGGTLAEVETPAAGATPAPAAAGNAGLAKTVGRSIPWSSGLLACLVIAVVSAARRSTRLRRRGPGRGATGAAE